jgi:hypothetical protein
MKSGFYAVIGKTDYLKSNNRKIPIWELTEYQPTSWLVHDGGNKQATIVVD